MRRWWSGQSQQTVNLSALAFAGSNPARRTKVHEKSLDTTPVIFRVASKLLCLRILVRAAGIIFAHFLEQK